METVTTTQQRHPFNPRYWTAFTWLGIPLWLCNPILLNFIRFPLQSFIYDSDGQLILNETYNSISEIPFLVGWPLPFIVPDMAALKAGITSVPSVAVWPILGVNILLIILATLALIYCSQKLLPRFSIMAVFIVTTVFALYYALPPLIHQVTGFGIAVSNVMYFSPLAGVFLVKVAQRSRFSLSTLESSFATSRIMKSFRPRELNYDSPDDTLAMASQFEHEGRWEEAIKLFQSAAKRWPEQAEYVKNSIAAIETKKSTA